MSRLLKEGGNIAFYWTVHVPSYDDIYVQIRDCYRKYAPQLDDSKGPTSEEVIYQRKKEIIDSKQFEDIKVKDYTWYDEYSSDEYISLLNTNSRHRLLEDINRQMLFEEIKTIINSNGGKIKKQQLVALFLARKS